MRINTPKHGNKHFIILSNYKLLKRFSSKRKQKKIYIQ